MISSVVVFHSDLARLRTTLTSLRHQSDETIVVDVSSQGEALTDSSLGVEVLDGAENRGYGWACNLGIAAAHGDLVLISNSDVVYADGSLAALARTGASGGLVAPLQTTRRGSRAASHTVETLQMGISVSASLNRWWGIGRRRFVKRRSALLAHPPAELWVPPDMTLSGASLLADRANWERVAGFDERFFLYQEDADLSVRCRLVGVLPVVATEALAFHDSGSARAGLSQQITMWAVASERSAWRAHHLPVALLVGVQLVGMVVRAAGCALSGRGSDAHTWWRTAWCALRVPVPDRLPQAERE